MSTSTGRERPWRATAFVCDPTGQGLAGRKREVAGRASAKTEAGLARFVAKHEARGHAIDVVEVLPLEFSDTTSEEDTCDSSTPRD